MTYKKDTICELYHERNVDLRLSDNFQIGKAGEHLVCADLILKGFGLSMADEALPYDILLDIGSKILKIQVKTTQAPKTVSQWTGHNAAYVFHVKRKGAKGVRRYSLGEIDIFALVALDTRQVGYIINAKMPTTHNIRVEKYRGQYYDEQSEIRRRKVQGLNIGGNTVEDVARMANMSKTSVRNYLSPDYKPYKTNAIYMSDIAREREWFCEQGNKV